MGDKMKVSIVVTVLNEAETILVLLFGLLMQIKRPNEVIIVDGGSTDGTVQLIKVFKKKYLKFPLQVFIKKGNRSMGRNFGIKKSTYNWIAITDAGCVPHRDWLEKLVAKASENKTTKNKIAETKTAENKIAETKADVVAGYYDAIPETDFQSAVVPYMLVMSDRVDPKHFLPATRSMLIKKAVWKNVGGFDETLGVSEDYAFAKKLIEKNYQLRFAAQAKVSWLPINSLRNFYKTVRSMAQSDAQAGIIRVKVYLVLFRYLLFLLLAFVFFCLHWILCMGFVLLSAGVYCLWAIWKNVQYLDRGWFYLPLLQVTADLGVMSGMLSHGILKRQFLAS